MNSFACHLFSSPISFSKVGRYRGRYLKKQIDLYPFIHQRCYTNSAPRVHRCIDTRAEIIDESINNNNIHDATTFETQCNDQHSTLERLKTSMSKYNYKWSRMTKEARNGRSVERKDRKCDDRPST